MYTYAQIDKDTKICNCISHLSGTVDKDNLILLENSGADVLGKRWTGSTWEDVPSETETEETQEPTNGDLLAKIQLLEKSLLDIMEGQATIFEMQLAADEGA